MPENSGNAGKKNLTSFKPGQSGNPSGRKPMPPELMEKLRGLVPEVIEFWVTMMRNPSAKDENRIRCAENIHDRAYGKAPQALEVDLHTRPISFDQVLNDNNETA